MKGEQLMKQSIELIEINEDNWYECCRLEVMESQKEFMESNAVSILQSRFEPTLKAYAIRFENRIVGFLMYNSVMEELDAYWIYRIMIDQHFQGQGIGRLATELMLEQMKELSSVTKIVAGYHPSNERAHHLYASLGFIDEGERFGREMAVVKYIAR